MDRTLLVAALLLACCDLVAGKSVTVRGASTCRTSRSSQGGQTFGICSND